MNAKNTAFHFTPWTNALAQRYTTSRAGETKIGESLSSCMDAEYLILGISEDIGPRANKGNGGSNMAFDAFLGSFLNIQSNRFLSGKEVGIIGTVECHELDLTPEELRGYVAALDTFIINLLNEYLHTDKQLIVVGGGHNNAYPIIRSFGEKESPLHVLNIDPHADCRPLEGRHSGNPFSTALIEKQLSSYHVYGLHESYNSEAILDFLEAHGCSYQFFENYLDRPDLFLEDLHRFVTTYQGQATGIEIDMDCIRLMPSSAYTPSGFSVEQIRQAVRILAQLTPRYLHLPEGAPTSARERTIVGKTLAYLVADFIKCSKK